MTTRKTTLSGTWYPKNPEDCKSNFFQWNKNSEDYSKQNTNAAIVPHAGWFYSGKTAYQTFKALRNSSVMPSVKRIILFGGHYIHSEDIIVLDYDALETPFGLIQIDGNALATIKKDFNYLDENLMHDNTIEIQLPFIKYFFPDIPVLALYPSLNNEFFRTMIDKFADSLFIASADLTHYGSNYGFSPHGTGLEAYKWAKTNDFILINAILSGDFQSLVSISEKHHNTCSINSIHAVCQISFLSGKTAGTLIDYSSSYDIQPSSSFVGYCGIVL